jgi:general secretion pathway protein H
MEKSMCSASAPTGSPAVKATTRTSVPGSKPAARLRRARGFSLLELMVVVMLVALATGLTTLSLRDASQSKLEEEGARLSALLETARTQARIVGTEVRWEPTTTEGGFHFLGLPARAANELPTKWLDPDTRAEIIGEPQLLLGPEPLLPPQRVVLRLGNHEIAVGTDGLSPFAIVEGSSNTVASEAQ